MKKQTLEDFIEKFRQKFPDKKYSFDKAEYVNTHEKIEMTCDKGHTFDIRPCDLLNGYGCPVCGGTKKLTKEDFINKATYVHKGYFTYEHCDFTKVSSPVTVTCPLHGDIIVKASNHLNGANCKKCQLEGVKHEIQRLPQVNKSTRKLTTEDFIQRAKEFWGDRYVYDENTKYEKANKPLIITCREHGQFSITPNHFLSGRGCPYCGKNKKKTTEEIVNEIKEAQPYSDYDYSYVEYRGIHKNITLKCNKCGTIFSNAPSNLITYKNGCPGCNASQLELEMKDFLKRNNILFVEQKTFDWLKHKSNLKLDFYLSEYDVAIECQGIQHFKDVCFDGKTSSLLENQTRDKTKKELCNQNNVKIYYYSNFHIEFPYYVYEDKETMLNDIKTFAKLKTK